MKKGKKPLTSKPVSKSSKFQVHNLIKKQSVPSRKIDKSENITVWETSGANGANNFPQQLLQNVYNSPAGSSAIDLWHEFVEGDGFIDQSLNDIKVNTKQTLKQLNSSISSDLSSMWGVAILVSYNLKGEKTGFRHMPFESCRLGALNDEGFTDRIYYNPYYGTGDFDKRDTKWYYTYNPSNVLAEIATHKELLDEGKVDFPYMGQVFWFSIERPLARIYPQPFYYSAINWFQVDAKIQEFHNRNIDNNFFLGALINKYGDPDAPSGELDSNGDFTSTVGEDYSDQMADFSGSKNGGSILTNWFTQVDEKADISPFPNNTNDTLFNTIQTIVSDQIAIGTKCPRILLNIQTSGKLGDTQEILNAVRVMQGRTSRMRDELSSIYKNLLNGFSLVTPETDFEIKNTNPFDILPDWAVEVLTPEEKRKHVTEKFGVDLDLNVTPETPTEDGN